MIINGIEHKDVTITGNSNVQNMTMKIDEKAFSILIDKLYSRKKEAIVRELCSNANDAHIDAGISHVPYDLILPTLSSAELVVRDYGYGLSKDDVVYYLGTLFGSKSSESNDAIGGFGLGAKSPFCLVDSYHITSYHNGLKHSFFYVREAGGIPKFVHIGTSKSDEKSGIKFTVNVGEENLNGWKETTQTALALFAVKPNCNVELDYPTSEVLFDNIEVITGYPSNTSMLACMGGVIYPVDRSLSDIIKLDDFYRRVSYSDRRIVLRFEIGELDVAPSREALEYKQRTIKAINKKIATLNSNVGVIRDKLSALIKSQLTVVPYSEIFSNPPVSLFNVTAEYSMFTSDELIKHPQIDALYGKTTTLKYGYVVGHGKFRHIIKTCGNNSLSNSNRIIVNNTSQSYKCVSEQIHNANTVKIPKSIDNDTAIFFLTRVCDYKFGKGNYTIEYFKDLYVKPDSGLVKQPKIEYIIGVRDAADNKVTKGIINFDTDFILYAVNDCYYSNGIRYSENDISAIMAGCAEFIGDSNTKVHTIFVTSSTQKRLKLDTSGTAINIIDYITLLMADPLLISDMANHVAMSKFSRWSRHTDKFINYKYSQSVRSIIAKHGIAMLVTDDTVDIFKRAIVSAKTALIHDKFSTDKIVPLHYIENECSQYGLSASVVDIILADVVVDKSTIIYNIKKSTAKCTLQEVIELLY